MPKTSLVAIITVRFPAFTNTNLSSLVAEDFNFFKRFNAFTAARSPMEKGLCAVQT